MKKEGVILSLLFLLSLFVSYSTSFFFSKKKKNKAAIAPTITKVVSTTPVPKPVIKSGAGSNPRSHYLPEQCKRKEQDDKLGYPIFIPRLGAYHVNETKANHRFVSGMFEATHARAPHINSGAILFEADAKIGDVSGIVDLEHVGRCEVTRDGKEALLSFHIARPKEGLHIRLAPWKKLVLRNFFVFFTPKTRRYFARVAQFPYNWESSIVSMFSDKNIARLDMSTFPLISILPDLKGFPAGQLIIKQATIRSRLAFSFVKPITAKDIIRVNNTILVPEPTMEKGKLRATYSGRMDLSSLGFMLPSLSGLSSVRTRAYSNEKRFKLKATLPATISVLPKLVQLQDPTLFIVKKHIAFMPDQQAAEKANSRVYIRGALHLLDTIAEAQVEFGQFYSVIKANVSFNSLVSGLMTARSSPAEANPSGKLDFHAKIDFNNRLLRYVSRKGEKELSRAARLNTGLIISNKFSRLIAKTDKAIHRTNENVLRLKRRLLNGESHRIYKLQHKITQKERLLQIMDKQITSLTNHINNVLKIDNTTVSHKIDVTKRMLSKLTREGYSISSSTFSFVDQHKLFAAEKKLERYQRRLETALNASAEVTQVSKKITELTAQLNTLTALPDGDIIKQIISLQQQYSAVERDFEKAKRAALRIAHLKDRIATLNAFSKSDKGELKLNFTTTSDEHYFALLKLRQQYSLYSTRLNFVMYKLPPKLEQATHLVAQLKLRIADLKAAPATTPVDAISREARIAEINAELAKIEPLEKKMEKYLNDLARLRAQITKKNKKAKPLVEALDKMDRLHLKIAKLKDLQSYLTQKNANLQARVNLVFRAAETFSPKLRAKNTLQIKLHLSLLEKLLVDMKKVNRASLEKDKLKFQINLIKAQIAKASPRSKIALINKQANLQASLEAQSAIAWSEEAVRSAIKNILGKLKLLGLNLPFRYAQLRDRINANAIRIEQINKLIAAVAKEDQHPKLVAASKLFKGTEKIAVDAILTNIVELNSMLLKKDRLQLEKAALTKEISHEYAFNPMSSNNIVQLQEELAKAQQFITNGRAMYSTMDNLAQAIHETRAAMMSLSPQVLATPSFSFQAESLRLEHIVQKLTPASQPANTLTFQLHDLKEKIEKLLSATEHATQAQALAAQLAAEQFKLEGVQHLVSRKGIYESRIKSLKQDVKHLLDLQKKQENQPATLAKVQKRMYTITKEIHRLVARLSVLKSQLHYRHPVHRKLNIILAERASLEKRIIRMKDKLELMIEAEENLPVPTGAITTVFHDKVSRRLMKAIRHYENRLTQLRTFREKLAHKGFSLDISTIKIFQVWRARTRVSLRELATTSKFRHVDVWLKVNDVPIRVNVFFNPHKPKKFARRVLRKAIQKVLKGAR